VNARRFKAHLFGDPSPLMAFIKTAPVTSSRRYQLVFLHARQRSTARTYTDVKAQLPR